VDVLVLCGGLGTRVSAILGDTPKSLAVVDGKPFLNRMLDRLSSDGFASRFVLLTGHLGWRHQEAYGNSFNQVSVTYSHESHPLGTGGAVVNALRSDSTLKEFLLFNADSYVHLSKSCLDSLRSCSPSDAVILLTHVSDAGRFGSVELHNDRVLTFNEKGKDLRTHGGLINAGVYRLSREILVEWLKFEGALSLEREVLPYLASSGRLKGIVVESPSFVDIGTPQSLASVGFKQRQCIGSRSGAK